MGLYAPPCKLQSSKARPRSLLLQEAFLPCLSSTGPVGLGQLRAGSGSCPLRSQHKSPAWTMIGSSLLRRLLPLHRAHAHWCLMNERRKELLNYCKYKRGGSFKLPSSSRFTPDAPLGGAGDGVGQAGIRGGGGMFAPRVNFEGGAARTLLMVWVRGVGVGESGWPPPP